MGVAMEDELERIFKEAEDKVGEWNDASAWLDRHGVPKDMSLEARIAWLFNGSKEEVA